MACSLEILLVPCLHRAWLLTIPFPRPRMTICGVIWGTNIERGFLKQPSVSSTCMTCFLEPLSCSASRERSYWNCSLSLPKVPIPVPRTRTLVHWFIRSRIHSLTHSRLLARMHFFPTCLKAIKFKVLQETARHNVRHLVTAHRLSSIF